MGPVAGLPYPNQMLSTMNWRSMGVRHGLAHLLIVEGRPLGVDEKLDHWADHLVALGRHLDARQLRELLGVAVGHRAEARHVRLAFFERGGARCLVVDEAHDDAIEIRQALRQ
jgi:hypothetical protein